MRSRRLSRREPRRRDRRSGRRANTASEAYVVSDVVVVGGLDQQVQDAVDLELGSGDLFVAVEDRSSTLGIRLPTPVEHEVKERLFAIDV